MTYEYACAACGHQWEAQQSISEAPLKKCPHCGKLKAKRQISGGQGFILKGGGWYSDLYSSPSAGKSGGEGKGEGEGKTEAKTEAKTEGKGAPSSESKTDSKSSDPKPAAAEAVAAPKPAASSKPTKPSAA